MSQSISRSEAREVAFRIIFSGSGAEALDISLDGKKATEPEMKFINKILDTVQTQGAAIDEKISGSLVGWTIDRLNKTDLAVLRLAAAEISIGEVPKPVIINECVNIAKKYGVESSGGFVNGVLCKFL